MTNPANNPNENELDIGVQSQYVNPLGSANLTRLDVQQATAKTPQQAEFDRQQEAVEREYQRQREIAKEEFQRQQEAADQGIFEIVENYNPEETYVVMIDFTALLGKIEQSWFHQQPAKPPKLCYEIVKIQPELYGFNGDFD